MKKLTNMYYHVTLWKDIKDNEASKKDTQVIMGFCAKEGFGVTKLQLQAEPVVTQPQYQEEYIEPEPEGAEQP